MTETKQVTDARRWLEAAAMRQNRAVHAVHPPLRLERLQHERIPDIHEHFRKWIEDTGRIAARSDVQRVFDCAHNPHFPNLRLQLRETFDKACEESFKHELALGRIVVRADEITAAKRAAIANEKREREQFAKAQQELDARKKKIAELEGSSRP